MSKFTALKAIKNKKRILLTNCTALLLVVCAVFGMFAYLTNADNVSNTFSVGDVKIELSEPNFSKPDEALVPNQTIKKNPKITNTGKNDAVVFMKITVPVRDVKTVSDDGKSVIDSKSQEVYTFKSGEQTGFNSNWIKISEKPETDKKTYIFGYNKKLSKDAFTETLFDSITYINVLEGEIQQGENLDVQIDAYGVQADGINMDTSNLTVDILTQIYNTYIVAS